MKKQCKKFPSWGCKGLLLVALSSLVVVAHAQSADVCFGTPYTIASAVDASGATAYRWLENGQIIPGASAATFPVPANKAVGNYTYIRQAKSADCDEWQSSNEFVVTVFNCSFSAGTETGATATFIDPRDGKKYKTVVMPDGRTWFAQNLNYTKDLTFNTSSLEANSKPLISGALAIGSYWCPGLHGSTVSEKNACDVYGALYAWNTAMMIDGKYTDESKNSSAWDGSEIGKYTPSIPIGTNAHTAVNHGRGGTDIKGGGRGICPMGWHIPTLLEWAQLYDAVDGTTLYTDNTLYWVMIGGTAGNKLKSKQTSATAAIDLTGAWEPSSQDGNDEYGFELLPNGIKESNLSTYPPFLYTGTRSVIWSSSLYNSNEPCNVQMRVEQPGVGFWTCLSGTGNGIRCLKH